MTESFEFKEAGIPNIIGTFCANITNRCSYTSGAFTILNPFGGLHVDNDGINTSFGYHLDASRSSAVYKNDCTTVQPASFTLMYIMKVK